MYAILEGDAIRCAPRGVTDGYKEVIYVESLPHVEGHEYEYGWEETETNIVQTYTLVPIADDPSAEELLSILTGESE